MNTPLEEVFPLYKLRLRTPQLLMRLPSLEETAHLAKISRGNILPAEGGRWMGPWTQLPSPQYETELFQYYVGCTAAWTPNNWRLELALFPEKEGPIGFVGVGAKNFAQSQTAELGFWILRGWQGRGLGKEMLRATLQFLFETLRAERVLSAAHPENTPSQQLHLSCGFWDNGTQEAAGDPGVFGPRYILRKENWERQEDVLVEGFRECSSFFGR